RRGDDQFRAVLKPDPPIAPFRRIAGLRSLFDRDPVPVWARVGDGTPAGHGALHAGRKRLAHRGLERTTLDLPRLAPADGLLVGDRDPLRPPPAGIARRNDHPRDIGMGHVARALRVEEFAPGFPAPGSALGDSFGLDRFRHALLPLGAVI